MGIAAVFGLTRYFELMLWILIAFVTAFLIVRSGEQRLFITGFLAGLFMALWNGVISSVFSSTYLANNPEAAAKFSESDGTFAPTIMLLLAAPVVGAIYGSVVGLITLLVKKVMKRQAPISIF